MKDKTKIKEPKIGDKIYVPSSYHVYCGEDDFEERLLTEKIKKLREPKDINMDEYVRQAIQTAETSDITKKGFYVYKGLNK